MPAAAFANSSQIQHLDQHVNTQPVVNGDVFEDAGKRACFDGVVRWNYFVVLTIQLCGYPNMGSLLARHFITQSTQRLY